jgi:hypothetical protein
VRVERGAKRTKISAAVLRTLAEEEEERREAEHPGMGM